MFCRFVSWLVCAAPYAVVSEDTIAPMFNPDPMPLEVIKALALDGEPLDELGEMTELMGFCVRALRYSIYRQPAGRLKQAAYQNRIVAALGVLIEADA